MKLRAHRKKKECAVVIDNVTENPVLDEDEEFSLFNETTVLEAKIRGKQKKRKPRKRARKGPSDSEVEARTAALLKMIESAEKYELCVEKHSPVVLRSLSAECNDGVFSREVSRKADVNERVLELHDAKRTVLPTAVQSLHDSVASTSHQRRSASQPGSARKGSASIFTSHRSSSADEEVLNLERKAAEGKRKSDFVVKQRGSPCVARRTDASIFDSSKDCGDPSCACRHNPSSDVFGSVGGRTHDGVNVTENRISLTSLRKSGRIVEGEESFLCEMDSRLANVNARPRANRQTLSGPSRPLFLTSTPIQGFDPGKRLSNFPDLSPFPVMTSKRRGASKGDVCAAENVSLRIDGKGTTAAEERHERKGASIADVSATSSPAAKRFVDEKRARELLDRLDDVHVSVSSVRMSKALQEIDRAGKFANDRSADVRRVLRLSSSVACATVEEPSEVAHTEKCSFEGPLEARSVESTSSYSSSDFDDDSRENESSVGKENSHVVIARFHSSDKAITNLGSDESDRVAESNHDGDESYCCVDDSDGRDDKSRRTREKSRPNVDESSCAVKISQCELDNWRIVVGDKSVHVDDESQHDAEKSKSFMLGLPGSSVGNDVIQESSPQMGETSSSSSSSSSRSGWMPGCRSGGSSAADELERSVLSENRSACNVPRRTTIAEERGSLNRLSEMDVDNERNENRIPESSRISGMYGIEEEDNEEELLSDNEQCSSSSSADEEEKWKKVSAAELSLMRKSAFWSIASKVEHSEKAHEEDDLSITCEMDVSDGCRNMSMIEKREQLPFYLIGYRWSKAYAARRDYLAEILHICGQKNVLSWRQLRNLITMNGCKLGEGSYGEVFLVNFNGKPAALKIVPVSTEKVEGQMSLKGILPELIVSKEMSALRDNENSNRTEGFVELFGTVVVKGSYPKVLINSWKKFEQEHKTYNENPELFSKDQRYLLFAFENGGVDLEKFAIESVRQAYAILYQVAVSVAVAEVELDFEHRDLHVGNVLVSKAVDGDQRRERVFGHEIVINLHGARTKIIDFTISRIYKATSVIFANLEDDKAIFEGKDDFQFDVYRLMRKANHGNWMSFNPQTNAMWLIYLAAFCWRHLTDRGIGTEGERIEMFQHFLTVRLNKGRMLNWVFESSPRVSDVISVSVV